MSEAAQQPDDQDESDPFQVMPDLDGDQFERLKEDIKANGVEYPIIVDGDIVNGDGDVIDGHHRLKAWVELGRDPRDIPKRIVDKPESENYHRAFRTNLLRRDLADGTKRKVVEQYLLEHPERLEEDTEREIAESLGVSQGTVTRAKKELEECGKLNHLNQLSTEEKKELVREYVDENPDASNREVAKNVDCDVSHVSVGNWRPEDDDSDGTTGLDTFTTSPDEEEKTFDILDEAKEGDETANEQVERVSDGETTVDRAHETVEDAIEEREREQTVESISESVASDTEEDAEESIDVSPGDVWELGNHTLYCGNTASEEFQSLVENAAFAFADPPYAAGVAEWDDDESEAFDWQHDWLHDVSDIVAVTPGIVSIFDFAQRTTMPYQWSVASWIKNGMTRGDLGFGNWIYIALFADEDTSLHRDSQDVARVTVKTSETDETDHKGRKPSELMVWLLERFSEDGDTVVDPFAGSGSTLFAAEEMNRECTTGDLDPEFCADIINRWNESHPDQEASLWGDGQ